MSARLKLTIALLMGATIFRAQTVLFLPEVAMFGGPAPDAWFAPWLSDAILGFMLPAMLWLFWNRRGAALWGALAVYNAVGAFDYFTGLATQWTAPMPVEMAAPATVFLGIGVFMICQVAALALLFRRDVIRHFTAAPAASSA